MKILSMNCASCAAPLEIKPETTQFVCAYCESAQIVDRSGGTVTLNLVAETLGKVQQNTDRTASELALVRLRREKRNNPELQYPYLNEMDSPPEMPEKGRNEKEKFEFSEMFSGSYLVTRARQERNKLHDIYWKLYDDKLAAYKKEMLGWPSQQKENDMRIAEWKKRCESIDAEIATHEAIVKRS